MHGGRSAAPRGFRQSLVVERRPWRPAGAAGFNAFFLAISLSRLGGGKRWRGFGLLTALSFPARGRPLAKGAAFAGARGLSGAAVLCACVGAPAGAGRNLRSAASLVFAGKAIFSAYCRRSGREKAAIRLVSSFVLLGLCFGMPALMLRKAECSSDVGFLRVCV